MSAQPPGLALPLSAPVLRASSWRLAAATLAALMGVLLWDASGWDVALARLAGDSSGFALRDHWALSGLGHGGARKLSWLVVLALAVGVRWPFGPLKRLRLSRRLELLVLALGCALLISVLKSVSPVSCPWDLEAFGGLAQHLSHWLWQADGGPGRCFPAGHASTGFCLVIGYFIFRDVDARLALRWLAVAVGAGLVLGLVQQLRGAHFMSHTLWTAWLCWTTAWLGDALWRQWEPRSPQVTA